VAWRAGLRTSLEVLGNVVAYVRLDTYASMDVTPEAISLLMHWEEMTSYYEPARTPEEIWAEVDEYLRSCS
jgi:hypothetical protein